MTAPIDWADPPPDGWTTEDLDRLAVGGHRRELIDGVVLAAPVPGPSHQRAANLLGEAVRWVCPPQYEVTLGREVHFNSQRCLIPDVAVIIAIPGERRTPWLAPREVVIAIEIVSPTSLVMDRVTKPAMYAAAGIPYYWRVETDGGIEVSTYRLDLVEEVFRQTGEFRDAINLPAPWPIKIPIGEITPRYL